MSIDNDYVYTNIGTMLIEDYLDIEALKYGFESYEDLVAHGLCINVCDLLEVK